MPARLVSLFKCIRYTEVVIFQVPPFLGVAFSNSSLVDEWFTLLLFAFGNVCLFTQIFAFNDWGDIDIDSKDVNKRHSTFTEKGVSSQLMLLMTVALSGVALATFYTLGVTTFVFALGILGLGFMYSHPMFAQKRIPIVASLNHLLGGVTMFLLGYSLFREIDLRGIAVSIYFAVVFMAGHLCQEVRDHDQDKLNGAKTSAVQFGKRRIFLIAFLLFLFSFGYFLWLVSLDIFPSSWIYAVGLVLVIAIGFFYTWKTRLSFHDVCRFQSQYRLVFAVITGFMLLSLFFKPFTS